MIHARLPLLALTLSLAAACGSVASEVPPLDGAPPGTDAVAIDAAIDAGGNGTVCNQDADCASGVCSDGVCCNTRCDEVCLACDLPGSAGTCMPAPADTTCGVASCDEGQASAAPRCDGRGTCATGAPQSCGAYVCEDDQACAVRCTDDTDCSRGNVCAGGVCAPPTCTDRVRTPPETDVDCGGGTCRRCAAGKTCQLARDCESGTCSGGTCTAPTYTWRTGGFGACSAGACSLGTQTRTVWCERSDGSTVDDALCSGPRPAQTQSCTNTVGCTWYAGSYGACSARCGGGTQTRPVYCRDGAGAQVPSAWCTGSPPGATATCNTQPCTVYVVGEPSGAMGPCWSPPSCLGGYPAFPSCPAGYAATRSETACGNPNSCGSNWALCVFYQTVRYGCANPTYVMGVASRECTWQ